MINTVNKVYLLDKREKHLLDIIQKNGPITKGKLLDMTKMKLSTLNRSIKSLLDEKIIVETATGESNGGRRPILYDVNPNDFYIIGLDISRTYVQVVVTNLKIQIVHEKTFKGFYNVNDLVETIPDYIENLISKLKIDKYMIIGIGIGVFDTVENRDSYKNMLKEKIDVPIFVDNGANTAVIGEYYFGFGKHKSNISYINCGVGIRTGVISSGVLIRTINNSEDALGHMIVDIDGEPCWCGNYGCVESYASIEKIRQKFISEIKKGRRIHLNKDLEAIGYIDVCNLAEDKNKIAVNVIVDAAIYFGTGLANYIKLFNSQLIILSGPLIKYSPLFYRICTEVALKKCHIDKDIKIEFNRGGYFGNKSMAVGAAVMVIQEILKL
ncbi:ROK family transcriptional regulator [Clostridium luticellarii]|jgi:predicted NBD/HSP70 family sugar kinase|uniref:ROK family transcriptional regulator n=1 Tax=Clostridium luticellarii TaxID=1691940 RepID=UPI002353062E|nr:ROK family transcriptional regulator [Clostridium luticellarii]MCI1945751.1 ROK family transcriptional regulator [Clostridium luticellarii]MCI1969079.1 ROK family transcriptional regulator [Clostridium luticellarii]MCI1996331.1 ROK family transcriptional regulator [Clostridium luticellarii]MCI2040658.1 ROK family transcriptional regulator [Clostridium luticellarii]